MRSGGNVVNSDGSYSSYTKQQGDLAFSVYVVQDPRTKNAVDPATQSYLAYVGAQNWSPYSHAATTYDDTEIKWTNINTPGPNFLIDRRWFIDYELKVTIDGIPVTSTDPYPFNSTEPCIGFRPYPVNGIAESTSLTFNNRTMTANNKISLYPRMEYWPQALLKLSNGMCPHRKPNGQTFADMDLRKGNSPFCTMVEFNDQDYPNTALPTIISTVIKPGKVARGSNFECAGKPRSARVIMLLYGIQSM